MKPEHQGQRSILYLLELLPIAHIRALRFKILAEPPCDIGQRVIDEPLLKALPQFLAEVLRLTDPIGQPALFLQ